jgi:hypothetical protein
MIPLFGACDVDGKRDVLEGRLVWLAIRALRLEVSVILDFGVWGRGERSALRALAAEAGADCGWSTSRSTRPSSAAASTPALRRRPRLDRRDEPGRP